MSLKERAMINKDTYGFAEVVDISSTDHQFANQKVMSGLYVGVAGSVKVCIGNTDDEVLLPTLNAGIIHKIFFNKIKKAGTTATDILGLD